MAGAWRWVIGAVMCLLIGIGTVRAADAPAPPAPPAGMSQADFDRLADALAQAVAARLAADGTHGPAEAAAPKRRGAFADAEPIPKGEAVMPNITAALQVHRGELARRLEVMREALPAFWTEVAAAVERITAPSSLGRPFATLLWQLGLALVALIAAGHFLRRGLITLRHAILHDDFRRAAGRPGLAVLGSLLMVDIAVVVVLAALAWGIIEIWFSGRAVQNLFAATVLTAFVLWHAVTIPFLAFIRPAEPGARLLRLNDRRAAEGWAYARWGSLAVIVLMAKTELLHRAGLSHENAHWLALADGLAVALILLVGIHRAREEVADWLATTALRNPHAQQLRLFMARRWNRIAMVVVALALIAWCVGVVLRDFSLFAAITESYLVVIGGVMADRFFSYLSEQVLGPAEADDKPWWQSALAMTAQRCGRVGLYVIAIGLFVQIWIVELAGAVHADDWRVFGSGLFQAGVTLFVAYIVWQILRMFLDRHFGHADQDGDGQADAMAPGTIPKVATRLRTMMPLVRIAMFGAVGILTTLIVLTELGINTAPLIAGASVFGLAISFGSQALVRDIVSGIFFMADDAFRVGEYIDTGKLKGTVEGMSVRSLRLRHQNGQVHTIPFGQIQSVTNYSRDWTTVKFNLRLVRDVDLELVRRTVKKIGQEMLEDAEFGQEMILPLKMQGVADIEPMSIVVRFKFTVRPIKPTYVQREALKRIYRAFAEKGIEFASQNVVVQTSAGAPVDPQVLARAGAAAAQFGLPPTVTE